MAFEGLDQLTKVITNMGAIGANNRDAMTEAGAYLRDVLRDSIERNVYGNPPAKDYDRTGLLKDAARYWFKEPNQFVNEFRMDRQTGEWVPVGACETEMHVGISSAVRHPDGFQVSIIARWLEHGTQGEYTVWHVLPRRFAADAWARGIGPAQDMIRQRMDQQVTDMFREFT